MSAPRVTHYENFPVASLLCPAQLRAAVAAIYHFARSADDLADEGTSDAATRLADLRAYRAELFACASGHSGSARWAQVFVPLGAAIKQYRLPTPLLSRLLDAFAQDVRFSAARKHYANDAELLDYCTRSANPVGRLLLHLYGVSDALSLTQSDQICSALQLTNCWQDLSLDMPRGRYYLSTESMQRFGVSTADLAPASRAAQNLLCWYVKQARTLLLQGAPLARRIPGRAGWELRLVVQGGLRILDKIDAAGFDNWRKRPKLRLLDLPVMCWRACLMP